MRLSVKLVAIILVLLLGLLAASGWFSIREEQRALEKLLGERGDSIAQIVANFSIEALLVQDYPVLETVLDTFGRATESVLMIEIVHEDRVVAFYRRPGAEGGRTFSTDIVFSDETLTRSNHLGTVRLVLSEEGNAAIIEARTWSVIKITAAVFVLLALTLLVILRETILKRIESLTRTVEAFASEQAPMKRSASVEWGDGRDELDQLRDRFAEMTEMVRRHQEFLQEQVAARTTALEKAKESAERANEAKSRFLASASHDLRQPIHAIRLFVAALSSGLADPELRPPEANLKIVGKIEGCVDSLGDLLNTILNISKLEAGLVTPEITAFRLDEMIAAIATEFRPQALDKGLEFRLVPSSLCVRSDQTLLGRIIRNLVSNSTKYTDEGRILIGARRRGAQVEIQVWDTGRGIPEDRLEEVFEEFHQLHNPARQRSEGLGLGLAIVRRMADLLDHGLDVASTPGKGSRFSILVPLTEELADAAAGAGERAGEPTEFLPSIHAVEGREVLIIEDDLAVLEAAQALLAGWGFQVSTAVTAEEVVRSLYGHGTPPDFVIADYRLPGGLSGIDALDRLRRHYRKAIPGVVITGDTGPDVLGRLASSDLKILHKPVEPDLLRAALDDALPPREERPREGAA